MGNLRARVPGTQGSKCPGRPHHESKPGFFWQKHSIPDFTCPLPPAPSLKSSLPVLTEIAACAQLSTLHLTEGTFSEPPQPLPPLPGDPKSLSTVNRKQLKGPKAVNTVSRSATTTPMMPQRHSVRPRPRPEETAGPGGQAPTWACTGSRRASWSAPCAHG